MSDVMTARVSDGFLVLCGMGLGLVSILGTIAVALSIVSAVYRRRTQLDDMEATLKMEMVQRGMPGEEIERILKARMGSSDRKSLAALFDAASASKARTWNQPAKQS
jgi:hypothetical protein